jgi:hypothetical protein
MMRRLIILATAIAAAAPALAVGMGPLRKEGVTDGPAKGFYLTLYNPYDRFETFSVSAIGADDEQPQLRVKLPAGPLGLRSQASRKFMIVAGDLQPGETYHFRICAERFLDQKEPIHARVCSRITARRLAVSGVVGAGGR